MNSCLLFCPQLCWWMLCCAISLCLCPDVLDQYAMASRLWLTGDCVGWQMVGLSYRGWACVDSGTGLDESCSRASCGGGPFSRPRQESKGIMRETMCWDWRSSSLSTIPIKTHCSSSHLTLSIFLPLWHLSTLNKTLFPSILFALLSAFSRILSPYYFSFCTIIIM